VRGTVITLIITLPVKLAAGAITLVKTGSTHFWYLICMRWLFRISSAQIAASFLLPDALLGIEDLIRDRDRYRNAIKWSTNDIDQDRDIFFLRGSFSARNYSQVTVELLLPFRKIILYDVNVGRKKKIRRYYFIK